MARRLQTKPIKKTKLTKPTKQNKLKTKRTRKNKVGGKPLDINYVYGPVDNANEQIVLNNVPIRLGDALYHPDFNLRRAAFEKILKPLPSQPEDERYTRRYGYTRAFLERVFGLAHVDGFQPIRELAYHYRGESPTDYRLNDIVSLDARKTILSQCKSNPGTFNPATTTVHECVENMGVSPQVSYSYLNGKYSVSKKGDLSYYGNNVYL